MSGKRTKRKQSQNPHFQRLHGRTGKANAVSCLNTNLIIKLYDIGRQGASKLIKRLFLLIVHIKGHIGQNLHECHRMKAVHKAVKQGGSVHHLLTHSGDVASHARAVIVINITHQIQHIKAIHKPEHLHDGIRPHLPATKRNGLVGQG